MTTTIAPLQLLQTFRGKLRGVFPRRADALFELIDALLLTVDPRSPVELSRSPAFRRRFSMVYDAMRHGQVDPEQARQLLAEAEPAEALTLAGCAVYGVDTTIDPRPGAETLEDRSQVYSTSQKKAVPGHQYSWLGRIVSQAPAWFAPRDVERVSTCDTPAAVAARQVLRLAATLVVAGVLHIVVADSGYAKAPFLAAFVSLTSLCVLVRLPCNRVLYGAPPAPVINPKTGKRVKRGQPPKHGTKFRLQTPPTPERQVEFPLPLGKGWVYVSAWGPLHFKEVPRLAGTVVRVEFFTPAGQPKYRRPLWLFWSGPTSVSLEALCQMYLARFGIEHFFRFAKQRLGLRCAKSPTLQACENWMWVIALAYTQLLLARSLVKALPRPWDKSPRDPQQPLTAGQVQRAWPIFSLSLGTPASAPRPSGKAPGRAAGFRPEPRPRQPVVSKKQHNQLATAAA
jgi:hypothetical protein